MNKAQKHLQRAEQYIAEQKRLNFGGDDEEETPKIIVENVVIATRLGRWGEKQYTKREIRQPFDIKETGRIFVQDVLKNRNRGDGMVAVCSSCISQIRLDNEGNKTTQIFTDIKCSKMPSEHQQYLIANNLAYALRHSIFEEHNFKSYHKFNGVNQINPEDILNKEEVGFPITAMHKVRT